MELGSWRWVYHTGKVFVGAFFRIFTHLKVTGRENVPPDGALLVVANHLNFSDPALLGAFLGRQLFFMAKWELFRFRPAGYFLGSLGAFPVHRGRLDRKAMRRSEQVLSEGKALLMFPEATRSPHASLQRALSGSALIASRHSVSILPVGVTGTEGMKKRFWLHLYRPRPRLTVNIGKPFTLPGVGKKLSKEKLAENTDFLMRRIAELLPPQYRGVYGEGAVED
jgi:1-acyl-sn-glycerol-3-phosphate acyltransferase